ncbi:hypothetical protein Pint_23918 [Pistacia integerrima]|uniref:Uncharacterized protein n=1 Tax=Pistacia integerrima TaxID=434235 RepID=A0ACC0YLS7_9ROSI|nr:hypothetical protein Pint_23918 [Pistacia integerrima]
MRRFSVFGFVLAILCAITCKYASYGDTTFPDCSDNEIEALIDFKSGLEDPEDQLSSWQGKNCCQWRGIRCENITGAVIAIDLQNRYGSWNLSGELRPSLIKLESLLYLDLSLNNFNDIPVPEFLGSLDNLQYLNLSKSGFSGVVPSSLGNLSGLQYLDVSTKIFALSADSLEWVTGLVSLKYLAMNSVDLSLVVARRKLEKIQFLGFASNKLHGRLPSSIGNMTFLNYFGLSDNAVEGGIPSSIGKLCSLKNFDLSSNNLTGTFPEFLDVTDGCVSDNPLPSLMYLRLSNNHLHGKLPEWLGQLENLEELTLSYNLLQGTIPAALGKLQNLTILSLDGNELNGTLPESFGLLSELDTLDVSSNNLIGPLFPSWLKTQKEVMFLDFSNASIADVDFSSNCLEGLIPLPIVEIELLDLSNNRFSSFVPENISESMPNLIFLSLSGNRLTGEIPASIGKMMLLQVIDLSSNNITGIIPSSIGNCSFLRALDLSYNNLSGEIPASLGQLQQLQSLHLSNNKLTGNLPSSFQNLSSLETLDLADNFSGNIPLLLGDDFPELRILWLRSNRFSGEIPSKLSSLSSLQVLDLAENNLTGSIPGSLGALKAMARERNLTDYLLYGKYRGLFYEETYSVKCPNDDNSNKGGSVDDDQNGNGDEFIDKWFYLTLGLGHAAGLLLPILILSIRKRWSDAYFGFVDKIVDRWSRVQKKRPTKSKKSTS